MSRVAHQAGAYPGFCSVKRLGIFLLPPGWDASPSQGYPRIKFAGIFKNAGMTLHIVKTQSGKSYDYREAIVSSPFSKRFRPHGNESRPF